MKQLMLQKDPIVRGADSMIIRTHLLQVILQKWNEKTMGGGGEFSRSGFNFQLFDPRRATRVFFSLIQGLAFRNTTGKSFSVVSLTKLVCLILLTCKSFLWVLSGVYSCFNLTVSAMTHVP